MPTNLSWLSVIPRTSRSNLLIARVIGARVRYIPKKTTKYRIKLSALENGISGTSAMTIAEMTDTSSIIANEGTSSVTSMYFLARIAPETKVAR